MGNDLCFVLMPFDKKPDLSGALVDFDAVYTSLIAPAIRRAGLDPLRADEEMAGGIIHKPMFERLLFCKFAVADLTTANANVFYELGLRHAVRPWSTVLLFSKGGSQLPFDVAPLRALPYVLGSDGKPSDLPTARQALVRRLRAARRAAAETPVADSPIYQLIAGYPNVDATKSDGYGERMEVAQRQKQGLAAARLQGAGALHAAEQELGDLSRVESEVLIYLFLSYRAVAAWDEMAGLAGRMPRPLATTILVQEQLGLALNRAGRRGDAEKVLRALIEERGPSSETYGILGRVYKDCWEAALESGQEAAARGFLAKAIETYLRGFEADWRDFYPGVNVLTLMEVQEPPDPRRLALHPVVSYAVERKIAAGKADYWDYATRLELAVLTKDEENGATALSAALAAPSEAWQRNTTVRNLGLIRRARERRQESLHWAKEAEAALAAWKDL